MCGSWECRVCGLEKRSLLRPSGLPKPVYQDSPGFGRETVRTFWGNDFKSCDEVLFSEVVES